MSFYAALETLKFFAAAAAAAFPHFLQTFLPVSPFSKIILQNIRLAMRRKKQRENKIEKCASRPLVLLAQKCF